MIELKKRGDRTPLKSFDDTTQEFNYNMDAPFKCGICGSVHREKRNSKSYQCEVILHDEILNDMTGELNRNFLYINNGENKSYGILYSPLEHLDENILIFKYYKNHPMENGEYSFRFEIPENTLKKLIVYPTPIARVEKIINLVKEKKQDEINKINNTCVKFYEEQKALITLPAKIEFDRSSIRIYHGKSLDYKYIRYGNLIDNLNYYSSRNRDSSIYSEYRFIDGNLYLKLSIGFNILVRIDPFMKYQPILLGKKDDIDTAIKNNVNNWQPEYNDIATLQKV